VTGLLVSVVCVITSCIAWYPLGGPVYAITLAFRGFGCGNVAPGSTTMFFCSAGVALLQMLPAAIVLVLLFVFRKPLVKWVDGITLRLPQGVRPYVAPVVATCIFVILWAGVHYTLPLQIGLLPQIIFPAIVGVFTFIVVRYGEGLQRALDPFLKSRDVLPRWLRLVGVVAIPLLFSVLITQPWRQVVVAGPQLEHFIVLVALVVAFLLLTPRAGQPAPVEARGGGRGGVQARAGRGGAVKLVLGGVGYVVCRLALAVGMAVALHAVLDLYFAETALAHDCTPDRPWDCQNTGGFNTTTATVSGVAGAGAAAAGSTLGEGPAGAGAAAGAGAGGGAAAGAAAAAGGAGLVAGAVRTRIVDGPAARNWLRHEGFIDDAGRLTVKGRAWWSQLSSGGPDPTWLEAVTCSGGIVDGRLEGEVVIIVRDRATVPTARPPAPTGAAATVVTENYSPGVDIRGTHDFIEHTRTYLNRLQNSPGGEEMFNRIMVDGAGAGHTVTIVDSTGGNSCDLPLSGDGELQPDGSRGPGSSTNVNFSPYRHSTPGATTLPDGSPNPADWRNRPPDVGVNHELNHALHIVRGEVDVTPAPNPVIGNNVPTEELRTVSLGPYTGSTMDDNAYRAWLRTQGVNVADRPHY